MASFAALPAKIFGVIFDCDGVIIDSKACNALYYNKILEAFDMPPITPEQEVYTYMATARQALEYLIPEHLHGQISEVAKKTVSYGRDIMPMVELKPQFYDFVLWLQSKNIRLAVHTNRADGMQHVVNKFTFLKEFSPIMTAVDVAPKPSPEGIFAILEQWNVPKESVLFVGDSQTDQQASAAAGVPFAAYESPHLAATVNVDSFNALQDILTPLVQ